MTFWQKLFFLLWMKSRLQKLKNFDFDSETSRATIFEIFKWFLAGFLSGRGRRRRRRRHRRRRQPLQNFRPSLAANPMKEPKPNQENLRLCHNEAIFLWQRLKQAWQDCCLQWPLCHVPIIRRIWFTPVYTHTRMGSCKSRQIVLWKTIVEVQNVPLVIMLK